MHLSEQEVVAQRSEKPETRAKRPAPILREVMRVSSNKIAHRKTTLAIIHPCFASSAESEHHGKMGNADSSVDGTKLTSPCGIPA